MTQGVKDLINAIASGDSVEIDAAFNSEMATRISEKLDTMRISVAQNMFRAPVAEAVDPAEDEQAPEEDAAPLEEDAEQVDEAGTITGKIVKGVARVGNELKDAGKGTAELGGQVLGTAAKTVGAVAALPGAIKVAYQQGKANTYKSLAG